MNIGDYSINFKMNDIKETVIRSVRVLDYVVPDNYLVLTKFYPDYEFFRLIKV